MRERSQYKSDKKVESVDQAAYVAKVVQQTIGLSECQQFVCVELEMQAHEFVLAVRFLDQVVDPRARQLLA